MGRATGPLGERGLLLYNLDSLRVQRRVISQTHFEVFRLLGSVGCGVPLFSGWQVDHRPQFALKIKGVQDPGPGGPRNCTVWGFPAQRHLIQLIS